MISLLTGENSFEIQRALDQIVAEFDGQAERFDGVELTVAQLPDLLMGATLFSDKRLIIIKSLSENKSVWEALADWCKKVSDDVQLVLVESKPDKRTRTYKELQKIAEVREFKLWGERDAALAAKWTADEAKKQGWVLNKKNAETLVERVGTDQWALASALNKLAVVDGVNPEVIEQIIDAQPSENVFGLFEAALSGKLTRVSDMIRTLELSEDPYMVFGLLGSQVFQLSVLATNLSPNEVAKAIGAHPFVLTKLSPYAKKLGKPGAKKIITIFANTDDAMKSSTAEPWLLIERALIKVCTI